VFLQGHGAECGRSESNQFARRVRLAESGRLWLPRQRWMPMSLVYGDPGASKPSCCGFGCADLPPTPVLLPIHDTVTPGGSNTEYQSWLRRVRGDRIYSAR